MKSIIVFLVTAVLIAAAPAPAMAREPMEVLRGPIDHVLKILADPQYKQQEQKSEQREKVWRIVKDVFDFKEISQRALARNWRDFTEAQQTEFVSLFSQLLANAYIGKMQSAYQNESVKFLSQEIIDANRAMVKTQLERESIATPIEYYMFMNNGQWRVYDIHVEGVSLTRNYKTQFGKILVKKSPAQLIDQLKDKVEKQAFEPAENS